MQKKIIIVIIIILIITPLLEMNEAHGYSFFCWKCGTEGDRGSSKNCSVCGWDICRSCGACKSGGCSGFKKRVDSGEYKGISNGPSLKDLLIIVKWIFVFFILAKIISIPQEYERKVEIRRKETEKEMQYKKDQEEKEKKRLLELKYKKEQAEKELQYKKEQEIKEKQEKERYEILLSKFINLNLGSVIFHKKLGRLTIIKIMENQIYTLDDNGNERRFPNDESVLNFIEDIQ